ncbi:MAG: heavy metal translocating P-type ATPase [Bacteroidales bacterium]|nr:heavy metal translocating P-type ATPase [Bacteroidales bacterium]
MSENHSHTHHHEDHCEGHCHTEHHNECEHHNKGEHHHHHHHHHHEEESPKQKLILIIVAAVLLAGAIIIERISDIATWQLLLVFLVPYLIVGFDTLKEAFEGIVGGNIFNEHFLMTVATVGALSIGFLPNAENQFAEAVFVMLFFQIGELFEGIAEGRSRKSIEHLMDIRPDTATVVRNGQTETVEPAQVSIGETIIVRPGEKVPLDGVVIEGHTSLNTIALTGESVPRDIAVGDELLSGCVNISGVVTARVTKTYGESTVSKIIDLVENAAEHKSNSETFIARFARVYTPVVVIAAFALAIVPPLLSTFHSSSFSSVFPIWLYRALMFLVVSCPCALVISVPLSFFGGIGGASRKGILIKGANNMDILARVGTVVFDKTGTLTHGRFAVEVVHPEEYDENHLLHLAAHVEHFSTHPIGAALRDAYPDEATDGCKITDIEEIAGQGISARIWNGEQGNTQDGEGKSVVVAVGNSKLMESVGAQWHDCGHTGTVIHIAIDGDYAGHIVINDQIKEDSANTLKELKAMGIKHNIMLTGDSEAVAADVAHKIGIDEYHAQLLPQDKINFFEGLKDTHNQSIAFVGDGINDAPVLSLADVGIAMGGLGSDAAIEAADIVLMDDKPSKIPVAIRIARRTIRIARQNVIFAIGVKISVLVLAAIGIATMWMAVFADVGVTVLAVFNAMRALKTENRR